MAVESNRLRDFLKLVVDVSLMTILFDVKYHLSSIPKSVFLNAKRYE